MNPLLLFVAAFGFLAIALAVAHFNEWRDRRESQECDRERDKVNRALARSRKYVFNGSVR